MDVHFCKEKPTGSEATQLFLLLLKLNMLIAVTDRVGNYLNKKGLEEIMALDGLF